MSTTARFKMALGITEVDKALPGTVKQIAGKSGLSEYRVRKVLAYLVSVKSVTIRYVQVSRKGWSNNSSRFYEAAD